jgi:hypothetical protein
MEVLGFDMKTGCECLDTGHNSDSNDIQRVEESGEHDEAWSQSISSFADKFANELYSSD